MRFMSDFITVLENFVDLEMSIIRATKINKVLKAILKLDSIPKEEEFQFKKRSQMLLDKWNKQLDDDRPDHASALADDMNGAQRSRATGTSLGDPNQWTDTQTPTEYSRNLPLRPAKSNHTSPKMLRGGGIAANTSDAMATQGIVSATFQVGSGALCFGSLSDIRRGANTTIQAAPHPERHGRGTIVTQSLEYNLPARNGPWTTFPLVDVGSSTVQGWFAAHSDVNPLDELDKILHVAGSPYDPDGGQTWNTKKTRAERVLVINRYDWGMDLDDEIKQAEVKEGEADMFANGNSLGLVDYTYGSDYVHQWIQQKPSRRGASEHGVWMYIPHAEYMFGRFGFDDDYKEARSFLFFTQHTDFFKTKFTGQSGPLRKWEKVLDRLHRGLREGDDYSGIEELRDMYTPISMDLPRESVRMPRQPPGQSNLSGPYNADEYIFDDTDLAAMLAYHPVLNSEVEERLTGSQITPFTVPERKRALLIEPW